MVKKIIFTILLVSSLSLLVACDKENKNVESGNGANKEVEAQETKSIAYEFYISEEGVYCTKAEWDEFYKIINDSFGDKIERIWLNGWHNESGVQGVTVDDDVIYNLWGMVDRKAYISNSCEDIIADFEAGEKVVLIGKDLVTDETTYTIGGEEYEIVGVDIEIANEIANEVGKKLVVKDIAFDSIVNELKSGKADFAAAGMSITPERLKEVDFSIEYTTSRQVVIVRNDSPITSINDIYDKKVAVQY